jgi:hypothetical protein
MNNGLDHRFRSGVVIVYAIAMAWVEAAVVYYLRTMLDRIEPYQPNPLPMMGGLGRVELIREAATLVMLLAVGVLAGRAWRQQIGYAAIAFGVWDIFYYLFLRLLCGWPHSLFDWDVLFLLPLPWWGPVLAPILIASLMILWGALATLDDTPSQQRSKDWKTWGLGGLGAILALYLFMADAFHVAGNGAEAVRNVLPTAFPWPWFSVALILMSAPLFTAARQVLFVTRLPANSDAIGCEPLLLTDSVTATASLNVSEREHGPHPAVNQNVERAQKPPAP